MAEVRLNSEKKLETNHFRLKIGTTNRNFPQVIYIEGRTFVSPSYESDDYSKVISEIRRSLKANISTCLSGNEYFENKFIVDFQLAPNGISYRKKSFLSFQFMLKQKDDGFKTFKEVREVAMPLINNIVTDFGNSIEEYDFKISKTKK